MHTIDIDSVEICDFKKNVLARDKELEAYWVDFNPKTVSGVSGKLFIKLNCTPHPIEPITSTIILLNRTNTDFQFVIATPTSSINNKDKLTFSNIQMTPDKPIYLEFKLRLLKDINLAILLCRIQIKARENIYGSPVSEETARIKAI